MNTCADAAAGLFCGCDGRTFATGCLTPDRTYAYANACGDGGTQPPSDAPADGAPARDVPALPYCPVEVDHNAGQNPDLRYRRAAFALPPGQLASLDPGDLINFIGTWAGTRRLAAPIVLGCEAADPRPECLADTVIIVRDPFGYPVELVVTTEAEQLSALTIGMPVALRARASRWDGATPVRYEGALTVRRAGDDRLLLAIATGVNATAGIELPIGMQDPVCTSRPEPLCRRVLTAYSVRFGGTSGVRVLAPGGEGFVSDRGTYLCRNRAAYRRTPTGGIECTDVTPSVMSFEIVRQPDA